MNKFFVLLVLLAASCGTPSGGGENSTIGDSSSSQADGTNLVYHLQVMDPKDQNLAVSILVENHDDVGLEFVMPTWAPTHRVRADFAGLVSEVAARGEGGVALRIDRQSENRWRVAANGQDFVFSYRVRAQDLQSGGSLIHDRGGLLNPASICMFIAGKRANPLSVFVGTPLTLKWNSYSSLPSQNSADQFQARNYGEFIREPIVLGRPSEHRIEFGKHQARILVTPKNEKLGDELAAHIKRLLDESSDYLGEDRIPREILFSFSFQTGWQGGNSMSGRSSFNFASKGALNPESSRQALALAAGAIPRMRAADHIENVDWLGVNFDRLMIDPMAWFPGAFGRYHGLHLLHRAGFLNSAELRGQFAQIINRVESEPAKRLVSLKAASENMALSKASGEFSASRPGNAQFFDPVDRGVVLLLLLDLTLIAETDGTADLSSLIDRLDLNNELLTEARFLACCDEIGGGIVENLARRLMNEKSPRPYSEISQNAGFRIAAEEGSQSQLGAQLDRDRIVSVARGTAAAEAGLKRGDRIVRFAGQGVSQKASEKIASYPARTSTTITVERRGSLVTLPIRLAELRRSGFHFAESGQTGLSLRNRFYGTSETP